MKNTNQAPPLSPHLQVYRLPLAALMSFSHRSTGVALATLLLVAAAWLFSLASGPETYAVFADLMSGVIGLIIFTGWLFAIYYHLANGIRHLFWDFGKGLNVKSVNQSGIFVIVFSLAATLISFIVMVTK